MIKAMVAYLKVVPQVRTYSDYLRAAREAEKEDLIELSQSSRTQTTDSPSKPRTTSFFPLRKLKGSQPFPKKPAIHLAQLEEEDINNRRIRKVTTQMESRSGGRIHGPVG